MLIPVLLFIILLAVVVTAHSRRKKGTMTEATYSNIVSAASIAVTAAALATLYFRLRN